MNDVGMLSVYSIYTEFVRPVSPLEQEDYYEKNYISKSPLLNEINDEAIISETAQKFLLAEKTKLKNILSYQENVETPSKANLQIDTTNLGEKLTPEQKQQVKELKERDREVKQHEQAHIIAASGINVSAPSYEYQVGPDGKRYAVGGEVSISFNHGSNPEEDIKKAEAMKSAALAPSEPSSQDLAVARAAESMIAEAKQTLAEENKSKE